MVRTSRSILRSLERALTSPSWAASTIWYYPVFVRTWPLRRPRTVPVAPELTERSGA